MPQALGKRIDLLENVPVTAIHRCHLGSGGALIATGVVAKQGPGLPQHGAHAGFEARVGACQAGVVGNLFADLSLQLLQARPEGGLRRRKSLELPCRVLAFEDVVARAIHRAGTAAQVCDLVMQSAPAEIGPNRIGENPIDVVGKDQPRHHRGQIERREQVVDVMDPGPPPDRNGRRHDPGPACALAGQRKHIIPHAIPGGTIR